MKYKAQHKNFPEEILAQEEIEKIIENTDYTSIFSENIDEINCMGEQSFGKTFSVSIDVRDGEVFFRTHTPGSSCIDDPFYIDIATINGVYEIFTEDILGNDDYFVLDAQEVEKLKNKTCVDMEEIEFEKDGSATIRFFDTDMSVGEWLDYFVENPPTSCNSPIFSYREAIENCIEEYLRDVERNEEVFLDVAEIYKRAEAQK